MIIAAVYLSILSSAQDADWSQTSI